MIYGITSLLGMAYLAYIIIEMSWCLIVVVFVGLCFVGLVVVCGFSVVRCIWNILLG